MAPDPAFILGSASNQYWSEHRIRMMAPVHRQALRAEFVKQRDKGSTGELRADGASLVRLVDEVNRKDGLQASDRGPRGNLPASMRGPAERPLEDRVADMKAALGKTPAPEARRKTWDIAVGLHGSAAEAKRRGYRNPDEVK